MPNFDTRGSMPDTFRLLHSAWAFMGVSIPWDYRARLLLKSELLDKVSVISSRQSMGLSSTKSCRLSTTSAERILTSNKCMRVTLIKEGRVLAFRNAFDDIMSSTSTSSCQHWSWSGDNTKGNTARCRQHSFSELLERNKSIKRVRPTSGRARYLFLWMHTVYVETGKLVIVQRRLFFLVIMYVSCRSTLSLLSTVGMNAMFIS